MKANHLGSLLTPFVSLTNRHAMSNVYKSLEISQNGIRACAPWGILEMRKDIGFDHTVYVDALQFIGVIKNLPAEELKMSISNNALLWECSDSTGEKFAAEGRISLLAPLDIPKAPVQESNAANYHPDGNFLDAFELGSLACGPQSMASVGVFGVTLDFKDDGFFVSSSDSITMASALAASDYPSAWPQRSALRPEAAQMLNAVLHEADKESFIDFQDEAIYAHAGVFDLYLKPAAPLKHDILSLCRNYADRLTTTRLSGNRIQAFIKRAAALAESKAHTYVNLSISKGAMMLSFEEGDAKSDEYYAAEGLDVPADLPSIRLDSSSLAKVLAHTDLVALDHIDRGILIFIGEKPKFEYLVSAAHKDEKA